MRNDRRVQRGVAALVKRATDLIGATIGLIVLSPMLVVVGLVVRHFLGAPIFFRQVRPGRDGKLIKIVKFRTMLEAFDANGELLPDDHRLTAFGAFLRASSLDELPQLWNVLRGDLSLVGPRPLMVRYLPRYSPRQARRHEVMPGITGWSQINGRNAISWEQKLELDVWYVENWSVWLDLKILLMTVSRVLRRRGVNSPGHVTMPEFEGRLEIDVRGAP
jgi:lipopolysaccharide/colanic/teichoic acid biosynthesis glycosyltransferase